MEEVEEGGQGHSCNKEVRMKDVASVRPARNINILLKILWRLVHLSWLWLRPGVSYSGRLGASFIKQYLWIHKESVCASPRNFPMKSPMNIDIHIVPVENGGSVTNTTKSEGRQSNK